MARYNIPLQRTDIIDTLMNISIDVTITCIGFFHHVQILSPLVPAGSPKMRTTYAP